MDDHLFAVIMAGGGGTRLWPLSRQQKPKQMLRLFGKGTLFQVSMRRLEGIIQPDHLRVVTTANQYKVLRKQYSRLKEHHFILEPSPKGTAAVVGIAALLISLEDPQAVLAVLTADHYIRNIRFFHRLIQAGEEYAKKGKLVTFGIKPTYPATGYGYIQKGRLLGISNDVKVFAIRGFKEKPNLARARFFVASRDHFWNSGMFVWRADKILEEVKRYLPDLAVILEQIKKRWDTGEKRELPADLWNELVSQTIDYGVMEKSRDVVVLSADDLGWSDVGSWESFFDMYESDNKGNVVRNANTEMIDTRESLIVADKPKKLIATYGIENLVIIETKNILLVCTRKDAQNIKKMINHLKEVDKSEFL
jgi:mannose-1-phosphate guanylyltransferase